jgi:4-hydroxy-4-methyl-2-oxoglutarate aldolase
MAWTDELAKYEVSLISDGLDALGIAPRTLPPDVRMLSRPVKSRLVGPAKTLRYRVRPASEGQVAPPADKMAAQLERMQQNVGMGDVLVIGFEGPPPPYGILGGLFSTLYKQLGVAGVVTSGFIRDLDEISALGLPVCAAGTSPLNARGRVMLGAMGETVTLGEVTIAPGDAVVADGDGVVIVPRAEADGVRLLEWLRASSESEKKTLEVLRGGGLLSDAYRKYGQL